MFPKLIVSDQLHLATCPKMYKKANIQCQVIYCTLQQLQSAGGPAAGLLPHSSSEQL